MQMQFHLPAVIDHAQGHTLIVGFARWLVGAALLDGKPLTEAPRKKETSN